MDMTRIIIKDGQKPTKAQLREIREAAKAPITYTADCPESTPAALAEFAAMAREIKKNRRSPSPVVSIRLMPDVLAKYKALGKDYTGVMADVLDYAVNNPEFLKQAVR